MLAVFSSTPANAQTLDQRTYFNAADATLPATPIASALGVASLMAGFAESIGPKMRP